MTNKIAIITDYINQEGGAEKIVELLKTHYNADLFCLFTKHPQKSVQTTFMQQISNHRWYKYTLPVAPFAHKQFDFSTYDCVISITSGWLLNLNPGIPHICYCNTPHRFAYMNNNLISKLARIYLNPLYKHKKPDVLIANSQNIKKRLKKLALDADYVIHPPIKEIFLQQKVSTNNTKKKNYLLVARLVPYKKIQLAIDACNKVKRKLDIIGTGPLYKKIKKQENSYIKVHGFIQEKELITYYKQARALLMPQIEDFGIVALEAQACGTPVISYAKGGAREAVTPKTSILYETQTTNAIIKAILACEKKTYNPKMIQTQAKKFNQKSFLKKFDNILTKICKNK